MSGHLPPATIASIKEAIHAYPEINLEELASVYRTTYETCRRIRKQMRLLQRYGKDIKPRRGRPCRITNRMKVVVQELVNIDAEIYQDEIADFIYEEFNVKLSQSIVSRLLKSLKITHKRIRNVACQREQILVDAWAHKMTQWDAKQLVFVDESASNELTGYRKYG